MTEYRWSGPDNFTWELIAPDGRTYAFATDLQERLADSMDALNELWDEFEVLESKLGDAEDFNTKLADQIEDLDDQLGFRDREIEGLRNLTSELRAQILILTPADGLVTQLRGQVLNQFNQIQALKAQLGIS